MKNYELKTPSAEFYLTIRDDGLVRVGLKGPFAHYDHVDIRGGNVGCRAWADFNIPYPLCSSDNLANILSQAAVQAKLEVEATLQPEIHSSASVGDEGGTTYLVHVDACGIDSEVGPTKNLLDVLQRIELRADYYLSNALKGIKSNLF
jgi:hypothetical protein